MYMAPRRIRKLSTFVLNERCTSLLYTGCCTVAARSASLNDTSEQVSDQQVISSKETDWLSRSPSPSSRPYSDRQITVTCILKPPPLLKLPTRPAISPSGPAFRLMIERIYSVGAQILEVKSKRMTVDFCNSWLQNTLAVHNGCSLQGLNSMFIVQYHILLTCCQY